MKKKKFIQKVPWQSSVWNVQQHVLYVSVIISWAHCHYSSSQNWRSACVSLEVQTIPPATDTSLEANLARIKLFRNEVYGHMSTSECKTGKMTWTHTVNISVSHVSLNTAHSLGNRFFSSHSIARNGGVSWWMLTIPWHMTSNAPLPSNHWRHISATRGTKKLQMPGVSLFDWCIILSSLLIWPSDSIPQWYWTLQNAQRFVLFVIKTQYWKISSVRNRLFDHKSLLFSLSMQPQTAFAILSYGKRNFAEAEGRKTEIGERCTRRRRGGGRGKKFHTGPERRNLAKETENRIRLHK